MMADNNGLLDPRARFAAREDRDPLLRMMHMPLKDQIKNYATKLVERRPDRSELQRMLRSRQPTVTRFADDGIVPNNRRWPLLIYRGVVSFAGKFDPATIIDTLFEANGWGRSWRDSIYDFVHYHSQLMKFSALHAAAQM